MSEPYAVCSISGTAPTISHGSVVAFPGVQIVDECPWKRVVEIWPNPLPSLADAAIVAVATANRYDAVATFDRKLLNRLEAFNLAAYW